MKLYPGIRLGTLEEPATLEQFDFVLENNRKINIIYVRASPILEVLTGFMIAGFIFFSGSLLFICILINKKLSDKVAKSLNKLNIIILICNLNFVKLCKIYS